MTAPCRQRVTITGSILLAVAMLGLLMGTLLQQSVSVPRREKQVPIVVVVQRLLITKAPPTAVPRVQQAVLRPTAQPAPKSPMRPQNKPLAMDTPTAPDPFDIPQGTEAGDIIGGGGGGHGFTIGGGGAGGECGQLQALGYLEEANREVASHFREDPTINEHEFFARVRLWFNSTGGVRQTEFESSTGDTRLDEVVAALLRTIDLKERVPECIQPITVQIVSPWNAQSTKVGDGRANPRAQTSETIIWQRPRAH